jgi:hypothetical protein
LRVYIRIRGISDKVEAKPLKDNMKVAGISKAWIKEQP